MLAGGFGSAVWETLNDAGAAVPRILRVGLPDRYVTHGKPALLHEEVGFTGRAIARRVEAARRVAAASVDRRGVAPPRGRANRARPPADPRADRRAGRRAGEPARAAVARGAAQRLPAHGDRARRRGRAGRRGVEDVVIPRPTAARAARARLHAVGPAPSAPGCSSGSTAAAG